MSTHEPPARARPPLAPLRPPGRHRAAPTAEDLARLAAATTVDGLLADVVPLVLAGVPGCDAAAVALVRDGSPLAIAASDDDARRVTEVQYRQGCGPCLVATGSGRAVLSAVGDAPPHEEWRALAAAAGFTATLAVPIPAPDHVAGALIAHRRAGDWPADAVTAATALAACAGQGLAVACRPEARDR
jgi:GAF domain-containing protein